ncbi:RidA family protein [Paracoccus sp. S-4012]|uniref:RidA family protein n=1 Tax=Paracoccus sp. S-4012 TaxID=2665648 RepID=UPI0012AF3ED2|nr:RidA family protein [Paracoccus sp. S-4012]MRX49797.1 RidA family protein [Paracoccus sp. S-4012]
MSIDKRLTELGITLPEAAAPAGSYVACVQAGNLLFVSGQLPPDMTKGRLGDGVTVEAGAAAARGCAMVLLAQARAALGSLDRVARVVKLTGFVASTPDFTQQPEVVNGASDLMVEVFGDAGRHARAAVSAAALPRGVAVEVEAVFEVR